MGGSDEWREKEKSDKDTVRGGDGWGVEREGRGKEGGGGKIQRQMVKRGDSGRGDGEGRDLRKEEMDYREMEKG